MAVISPGKSIVRKDLTLWGVVLSPGITSVATYSPNANSPGWVAERAGSITGLQRASFGPITAGAATMTVYRSTDDGASFSATGATLAMVANRASTATFAAGTHPYNAGDILSVHYVTSGGYAPDNNGTALGVEVTEAA